MGTGFFIWRCLFFYLFFSFFSLFFKIHFLLLCSVWRTRVPWWSGDVTEEINRTHSIARSSATFSKENCWNLSTLYSAKCGEAQSRFNISFVIVDFILFIYFFCPKLKTVSLHLIRCSFSSPTLLLGPLSMKAERTELMRPVEPSLQRSIPPPPVLGDGKFSVTGIGRDSRCAPWWMSRRPAPLYIYSRLGLYIYIHCDACACTFTPASSSTLELLISNVIMNHVSLFSFSSQQLRNVFLFSSFGTWFVFSRSSVSSSW